MEQITDRGNHHAPADPGNSSGGGVTVLFFILLLLALGLLGGGIYFWLQQDHPWTLMAVGAASVIAVLAAWGVAGAVAVERRANAMGIEHLQRSFADGVQQIAVLLHVISEQQILSDRAKAVAFREKDRDALRRAIKEDLARKDYEAAMVLVNEMQNNFGYRQEADRFREEINRLRMDAVRKQIGEAATTMDAYCRQEKWTEALREAEKLMVTFPGNDQVQHLPQEIENRRQQRKKQLLDSWQEALNRKDIDGSIEILKKLDLYLTRAEGEAMSETARGIFKEKLSGLGERFKQAVQDHNWTEAIRVGETIARDFPNSGIAREVRDQMDNLRRRALQQPEPARS